MSNYQRKCSLKHPSIKTHIEDIPKERVFDDKLFKKPIKIVNSKVVIKLKFIKKLNMDLMVPLCSYHPCQRYQSRIFRLRNWRIWVKGFSKRSDHS